MSLTLATMAAMDTEPHCWIPKPMTDAERALRRVEMAWLHAIPAPRKPRVNRQPPTPGFGSDVDEFTGFDAAADD